MNYDGIPSNIDINFVREWVRSRVSGKRFAHIEGVAEVAKQIARKAGCDEFLAELSGWLHDASKEIKAEKLVEMAREYGLPLDSILEKNGHLLHGPVGAEFVKRELGITNKLVYDAIAEHTLGATPMTELSKIAFLADCLEASRPKEYTDPIWKALDIDGDLNMDAAICVAMEEGLKYLIADKKVIHPKTVQVRNYYLPSANRV